MSQVDGKITLGLNVTETKANLRAGLDSIIASLNGKRIKLKPYLVKSEVKRQLNEIAHELSKTPIKVRVQLVPTNAKNLASSMGNAATMKMPKQTMPVVSSTVGRGKDPIANMKKQMDAYRKFARENNFIKGLGGEPNWWNQFNKAIASNDSIKAQRILDNAKKKVVEFNKAITSMNSDDISKRVSDMAKAYSQLDGVDKSTQNKVTKLSTLEDKYNNAKTDSDRLKYYKQLDTALGELGSRHKEIGKAQRDQQKAEQQAQKAAEKAQRQQDAKLNKQIQNIERKSKGNEKLMAASTNMESVAKVKGMDDSEQFVQDAKSLKRIAEEQKKIYDNISRYKRGEAVDYGFDLSGATKQLQEHEKELSRLSNRFRDTYESSIGSFAKSSTQNFGADIDKFGSKIAGIEKNWSYALRNADFKSGFEEIKSKYKDIKTPEGLKGLQKDLNALTERAKAAGLAGQTLGMRFSNAFKSLVNYAGISAILYEGARAIREMTTNVINLDSAMVELKKVTNESDTAYDAYLDRAKETSVEIGSKLTDYVNSTADFSRLGYSMKDAEELAKVATIYSKVGDDIASIDDASSIIITTMKAFGVEANDAISIVDKLNEVSKLIA